MVAGESALKGPESEEHVIFFNSQDVRSTGSIKDVHEHNGQNIWIDLVDPTLGQIQTLRKFFPINESAMQQYNNKSKKAHIRVFDDQKFTVLLAIGFENSRLLTVEPIYLFVGNGWLITIRSVAAIGTIEELYRLFEQKDKHLMASSVNGLYYSIVIGIVNSYEQMLTSMELTIAGRETILFTNLQ
jgi:Mg2+ and Co2+ transporter CorA